MPHGVQVVFLGKTVPVIQPPQMVTESIGVYWLAFSLENQPVPVGPVVFQGLLSEQFSQIVEDDLRHDHDAGAVVLGVTFQYALPYHSAAGMLDLHLIPAVQITPPQGTQLAAAQASGEGHQVVHPIKQRLLQNALQELLHLPLLGNALLRFSTRTFSTRWAGL